MKKIKEYRRKTIENKKYVMNKARKNWKKVKIKYV